MTCPARNNSPSKVVPAHNARNSTRFPFAKQRRAISSVKLLNNNTVVFTHKITGICTGIQSVPVPRRTMNALASAIKNIKIETIANVIPV